MRTKLLFIIITTITFTSCKAEIKNEDPIEINKVAIVEEKEEIGKVNMVEESEKIEKVFSEFKKLYQELIAFKNNAEFIKYGFGKDGKYNNWLEEVRGFKRSPYSKLLIKKGVLIGELEMLGIAYVNSKGKETEVTKTFNEVFNKAISE